MRRRAEQGEVLGRNRRQGQPESDQDRRLVETAGEPERLVLAVLQQAAARPRLNRRIDIGRKFALLDQVERKRGLSRVPRRMRQSTSRKYFRHSAFDRGRAEPGHFGVEIENAVHLGNARR